MLTSSAVDILYHDITLKRERWLIVYASQSVTKLFSVVIKLLSKRVSPLQAGPAWYYDKQ